MSPELYGSPPMVGERSPKPLMWVRFLPSVLLHNIASNSTLALARAGLLARITVAGYRHVLSK